ncbi:MAG TPA: hypothetical protein PLL90_08655, partial [Bacteroidales bacterium]|nr:hypothetical protein [Bacteroidales bacterium]
AIGIAANRVVAILIILKEKLGLRNVLYADQEKLAGLIMIVPVIMMIMGNAVIYVIVPNAVSKRSTKGGCNATRKSARIVRAN